MQVALLLYVAVTVPLRAGFNLDVPLWSVGFFVDMAIDVYFVTDICLNFRTAFYDQHGVCEDRGSYIACNYLRGWFLIDFVSTLPLPYLAYLAPDDPGGVAGSAGSMIGAEDSGSANMRALKALRLVRLSKMLRLVRTHSHPTPCAG